VLAEIVDELALALVAPLRADCGKRSADVASDGREMEGAVRTTVTPAVDNWWPLFICGRASAGNGDSATESWSGRRPEENLSG
jgi:hypothetical protein